MPLRLLCSFFCCIAIFSILPTPSLFAEQVKQEALTADSKTAPAKPAQATPDKAETPKVKKQRRPLRRPKPKWYMGRQIAPTMSASGAEWLIRKSRDREEQPRVLLDALDIKREQQVCDFGCGNGFHTLELAKRVGPHGKVFAVDIQQEMLDLLQLRATPRGLKNIVPVLATEKGSNLPPEGLDLVLMVDVYHELFEPEKILAEIHASLNKTGRLVLVEFREEDPDVPILPLHKMSQPQVLKELVANHFMLVGQSDALPWQHVLFFARDDSPLPETSLTPWQPKQPADPAELNRGKPQAISGESPSPARQNRRKQLGK